MDPSIAPAAVIAPEAVITCVQTKVTLTHDGELGEIPPEKLV